MDGHIESNDDQVNISSDRHDTIESQSHQIQKHASTSIDTISEIRPEKQSTSTDDTIEENITCIRRVPVAHKPDAVKLKYTSLTSYLLAEVLESKDHHLILTYDKLHQTLKECSDARSSSYWQEYQKVIAQIEVKTFCIKDDAQEHLKKLERNRVSSGVDYRAAKEDDSYKKIRRKLKCLLAIQNEFLNS